MPAITDDMVLPFTFLAIARMTITAVVDGGRITSDGGVMLLGRQSVVWAWPIGWSQ